VRPFCFAAKKKCNAKQISALRKRRFLASAGLLVGHRSLGDRRGASRWRAAGLTARRRPVAMSVARVRGHGPARRPAAPCREGAAVGDGSRRRSSVNLRYVIYSAVLAPALRASAAALAACCSRTSPWTGCSRSSPDATGRMTGTRHKHWFYLGRIARDVVVRVAALVGGSASLPGAMIPRGVVAREFAGHPRLDRGADTAALRPWPWCAGALAAGGGSH